MLGIQNYSQYQLQSKPSFKSNDFDKDRMKSEMDDISNQYDEDARGWNDLADDLENSDSKVSKKMGKGARLIASLIGLAGTFAVTKYSSKLTIETIKNLVKKGPVKNAFASLEKLKEPLSTVMNKAKGIVNSESVQSVVNNVKNSRFGLKVSDFVKNEKFQSIIEPLKTTFKSIKSPKINGQRVQSFAENVMAGTATASVAVDNLTGRNDDKNALELALV